MGLATISPDVTLDTITGIWGNMLFWAFATTTLTYVVVGITCAVCMRTLKGISFVIPFVFLGCGELRVLLEDAIACAFVAGIYVTAGWTMSSLAAFGWGVGLSLMSICLGAIVSWVPLYAFL